MNMVAVHWFRRDLRLHDNAALYHALRSGYPVLPVFIFDTDILDELKEPDQALSFDGRLVFIHRELERLKAELQQLGSDLRVYYGRPSDAWKKLVEEYPVNAVYTNHDYEPYAIRRDQAIKEQLQASGIGLHTYKDQVIFETKEVLKDDGKPYTVYTPYSKKWKARLNDFYLRSYPTENYFDQLLRTEIPSDMISLESMGFSSEDPGFFPSPQVDDTLIQNYPETRDIPSMAGTSRLSVHLRFGTISVRELCRQAIAVNGEKYLNELIWREFYMSILWYFPQVVSRSFRPEYDRIQWRNNEVEFQAWCEGKTGYPIVDAGMRELNATGYMHNRVRMITASFLTKHLLIDWRWGEAYFAKKLLDFELASNNGGWQWAAGTGVDAAPYFRVFNPYLQTQKFDPELKYIRKWIPELDSFDYPRPIVEHEYARKRCLETYQLALK